MLKQGVYTYDISCKNGKSHIFKDGKEIFEGSLYEIHIIFFNSNAVNTGLFECTVYQ